MRHAALPRPARPRRLAAVAAVLALLAVSLPAEAHLGHATPPPVDLMFTIQGSRVTALIAMEKYQVASWGQPPRPHVDVETPIPGEEAARRLPLRLEVAIDGVVVAPVLERFDDPPVGEKTLVPQVRLLVSYPTGKPPTSLRIGWKDFLGIIWETESQVPLLVEADHQIDTFMLTKVEREFTWHRRPPAAFRGAAPPPPAPPEGRRVPLVPVGLAAVGLALAFLPPLRRRTGRGRWAVPGGALATGGLLLALGVGQVETTWGKAIPHSDAQARAIFTGLLNNVYRAFDAPSEGAIYDLLSASVERQLLDGLYGDVYESLVLRDQGGAVARVEEVTPLAVTVRYPPNGAVTQFTVDATWLLDAAVSHMGHTHVRKNRYRAEVVVRHDGQSWHIAAVDMRERRRLDDGRGGLLEEPKDLMPADADLPPAPGAPPK